jgi:hypothetical protein
MTADVPGSALPRPVQVRAGILRAREAYVEAHFGAAAVQRLRAAASERLRALLLLPERSIEWFDFDLYVELNVLVDGLFGRGDLALSWEMARYAAKNEQGMWRTFALKRIPISLVMSLAGAVWSHHFNAGRLTSRSWSRNGVIVSITEFPTPHRSHCLSVGGWMLGTAELGPRANIVVQELGCRLNGGSSCEFLASWE